MKSRRMGGSADGRMVETNPIPPYPPVFPAAPATSLNRRAAIKTIAGAMAGVGTATACAGRVRPFMVDPPAAGSGTRRFSRVNVAPDRVIRTVVGLRPFRPSGFVVRAEPLGDKLLIHNYGHGGGGITLSWGTAALALEELNRADRSGAVAVIGCGAVGMATARLLQQRGRPVTIYARDLPPNTTSNIAGANWFPSFVFDPERLTPEFDAQLERAARLSHRSFQTLLGADYGVHWIEQYVLLDAPRVRAPDAQPNVFDRLRDLFPLDRALGPGEHPFASPYVSRNATMLIETPHYLRALLRDFLLAGGRIVVRGFGQPSELGELPEQTVINCTGLGARELFGDRELTPIKGQLTVLLPQPEVDYIAISGDFYMFPRIDGIILGGTHEMGVETLEPNGEAVMRVLAGHRAMFEGMR